jgi:hypothetical protein
MIERFHMQLKEALRARECGSTWSEHVPWVLLGLRAAPKEESGTSVAEAVFGEKLLLPNQYKPQGKTSSLPPPALPSPPAVPGEQLVVTGERVAQGGQRSYAEVAATPLRLLQEANFVYIRKGQMTGPFSPPYSGPYKVVDKREKVFDVQVGNRIESVSVDSLKAHRGGGEVIPASPTARGRPPGTGGRASPPPPV